MLVTYGRVRVRRSRAQPCRPPRDVLVFALVVLCGLGLPWRYAAAQETEKSDPATESPAAALVTPERTNEALRVQEVIVEGTDEDEEKAAAREIFGVAPGDMLDVGAVRLGLRRVYLTGPWADVRVFEEAAPQGVRLIIVVSPDVLVSEVAIESGALPAARLRAGLALVAGDRFRPETFAALERSVLQTAAELGYPRARVRIRVESVSPTRRRVRLQVEPGSPTILGRLDLAGEPRLSRRELASLLGLSVGTPFDREGLERGLGRVKELLLERRHLAAITEILGVTYDRERRTATVAVRVDAGPRYRVDYAGNHVLSNATLHTIVDETSLGGLDAANLEQARERLRTFYQRAGFARAKVFIEELPAYEPWREAAERVLRFQIEEGPRVEIDEIIVEGTRARDGRSLAADVWSFIYAETPTGDLFQPLELADLEELFGQPPGLRAKNRPLEEPDVILRPFTWPLFLPRVERKPLYSPALFEAARQRLLDQYRKDGFLQATITVPELIWAEGGTRLRVRYRVLEGEQTHIAGVRFEPPPPVPIVDLLAGATLKPGAPADLYAIEQMRLGLERNLRDQGYPFASVTEELLPAGEGRIDVLYRLNPGVQVTVAGVRFRGHEQTREFLLLDRMRLNTGDLYAASAVDESRQGLLRTGLFTSVNIGFLDDREGASRRVLLVDVVERPRYSIEAGAGGSLEDGPRAFSAVEVRNLFGSGVGLRGRGQINYPRALYGLYFDEDDLSSPLRRFDGTPESYRWTLFTEGQFIATAEIPKLYGLPTDVRLHMDTVGLREIRPAFTLMKGSLAGGVDLQPFTWLHLAPQLEVETSDFDCPSLSTGQSCDAGAPGLTRRVDAGTIGQLTLHLGTTIDARDNPFRPHTGVLASLLSDVALGDGVLRASDRSIAGPVTSRFWKLLATISGYVPLASDATLALTARAGNIFPLTATPSTNYIPLFKRFYLGGTNSVRGYNFDAVLPVDDERWPSSQRDPSLVGDQQLISLGGSVLLNGRAELRKTLVGDLELGLFTDTGQLASDIGAVSLAGFAIGAGVGLRYLTPVGPVVLDVAAKVIDGQRRLAAFDDLSRYNLHLSIGYF